MKYRGLGTGPVTVVQDQSWYRPSHRRTYNVVPVGGPHEVDEEAARVLHRRDRARGTVDVRVDGTRHWRRRRRRWWEGWRRRRRRGAPDVCHRPVARCARDEQLSEDNSIRIGLCHSTHQNTLEYTRIQQNTTEYNRIQPRTQVHSLINLRPSN